VNRGLLVGGILVAAPSFTVVALILVTEAREWWERRRNVCHCALCERPETLRHIPVADREVLRFLEHDLGGRK